MSKEATQPWEGAGVQAPRGRKHFVAIFRCHGDQNFAAAGAASQVVVNESNLEPGPSALRWLLGDDDADRHRRLQATILVRMGLVRG